MFKFKYVFSLVTFLLIFSLNILSQNRDREALIKLYKDCNGERWINNMNWCSEKPLGEWFGIKTKDGRVTEITLNSNILKEEIPIELENLTELEVMNFSNCFIETLPDIFGQMKKLRVVDFRNNCLEGEIPHSLKQNKSIEEIDLSCNNICDDLKAFSETSNLTTLNLSNNQIHSNLPACFRRNRNLRYLNLSSNNLEGKLEDDFDCPNLDVLNLHYNKLEGEIPVSLGRNKLLRHLILSKNRLTGRIPKEISRLSNLKVLNLSENRLSEFDSNFSFHNLVALNRLSLNNCGISGNFPIGLECHQQINEIDLSGNKFKGELLFVKNPLLKHLNLEGNEIFGGFPYFDCPKLKFLTLSRNRFDGEIPPNWNGLNRSKQLQRLDIDQNSFRGKIPSLVCFPELKKLNLAYNKFRERFIDNEIYFPLKELNLEYNYLSMLPSLNTSNIYKANVSNNRLPFREIIPFQQAFENHNTIRSKILFKRQISLTKDTTIQVRLGDRYTLRAIDDLEDNIYTWIKNNSAISSERQNTVTIEFKSEDDFGEYIYIIENPRVSNCTLSSGVFTFEELNELDDYIFLSQDPFKTKLNLANQNFIRLLWFFQSISRAILSTNVYSDYQQRLSTGSSLECCSQKSGSYVVESNYDNAFIEPEIYPNPANSILNVSFSHSQRSKYSLTLYDSNSSKVKSFTEIPITAGIHSYDISVLRAGIYILHLSTNEAVYIEKLVVE